MATGCISPLVMMQPLKSFKPFPGCSLLIRIVSSTTPGSVSLVHGSTHHKHRVVVDDAVSAFVVINRGVPQGIVLGPTVFSLMVNDIAAVSPMDHFLVKYADDITISVPVRQSIDTAAAEVENMKKWADINEMSLNFTKTWEMCMHGKTTKLNPELKQ